MGCTNWPQTKLNIIQMAKLNLILIEIESFGIGTDCSLQFLLFCCQNAVFPLTFLTGCDVDDDDDGGGGGWEKCLQGRDMTVP